MTAHLTQAALIATTTRLQTEAADPAASVWVSANAGTGKTHVLTQRVLRLLLTGTAPERILCLTYTKAAAAEMSKRVFDTLSAWVGLDDTVLRGKLATLLARPASSAELLLARTLFTRAIETPGGFKVQTIHAFCERLLQRFPLEAGIAPGFSILDDHTTQALTREAIDDTLREATSDRSSPLGQALTTAIRYAADDQFDAVLGEAIKQRELLVALDRRQLVDPDRDPFAAAKAILARAFNVRLDVTAAQLEAELSGVIDPVTLKRLVEGLSGGSKTDVKMAEVLRPALASSGSARTAALAAFLLTGEGEPRKSLMTKAVKDAHPDLDDTATRAQGTFQRLQDELKGLDVIAATLALYRLAARVLQRYTTAKAARAALDFEDLIAKTGSLLANSSDAAWVLYKLDGGLDHILVDEAQDTSPPQWLVIESLAQQFFEDQGAGSKLGTRTVFAVGDEKQSIYSFQGAAPEMFAAKGVQFRRLAESAGQAWCPTALTLSFRTVAPILDAVDRVFADPVMTPGLMNDPANPIRHAVKRMGQGGIVEIWPTEKPEEPPETDAWSPLDEETPSSPVTRLATRIASTIKGWLDTGEQLTSQGRAIRAGDILILVRKREPFATAIVAALKTLGVKVAGSDRISLTSQIGVQDLLSLGDFLTLPEDDLALAEVLKSPLFGLDDDDLLPLCHKRRRTLWRSLLDAAITSPRMAEIAALLKRWRKEADFMPPFEFFAAVLDHDGGRDRLINRLGPDAADGIDAFLNLALTYDDAAPPSLTGFLAAVRSADRTIKRDMEQGRDEVRVLTVHGSKGLEAPIVFLPDTCTVKSARSAGSLLMLDGLSLPSSTPQLVVWPVKGSSSLGPIADAKTEIAALEAQELNRLLYVALTRPRDRLYIGGVQTKEMLPAACWYQTISSALAPVLETVTARDGTTVRRMIAAQTAEADSSGHDLSAVTPAAPRPAWLSTAVPREVQPAIPVAPSRLAPYDFDAEGEPVAFAATTSTEPAAITEPAVGPIAGGANRFLRGTLTHALLQHLPSLPQRAWPNAAQGYIAKRGAALPTSVRRSIVTETLGILTDPTFAALFGPESQAEVPIVAELPNPKGRGAALRLTGQIDRLAVTGTTILIVDYKTNRQAAATVGDVPAAYIAQLAAYRLALAAIYPGKTIRAALLWTEVPLLMELPASALDHAERTLWEFGLPKLDVSGLPS